MYSSVLHGHTTGFNSISYKHAIVLPWKQNYFPSKDYPDSDFS